MLQALKAEVLGPDPQGGPENIVENQILSNAELQKPKTQMNGQEILWQERPLKRYGTGILYQKDHYEEPAEIESGLPSDSEIDKEELLSNKIIEKISKIASKENGWETDNEPDITNSNSYKPSSFGVSCLVDSSKVLTIVIIIQSNTRLHRNEVLAHPCGFYKKHKILVEGTYSRDIWFRNELLTSSGSVPSCEFTMNELENKPIALKKVECNFEGLEVLVVSRKISNHSNNNARLLTISLINNSKASEGTVDEKTLFQAGFSIKTDSDSKDAFLPYKESSFLTEEQTNLDDEITALTYRNDKSFAVGHGCAADWESGRPDSVGSIWTDFMPVYETPPVSAELKIIRDGVEVDLKSSMKKLAGLDGDDRGLGDLKLLIDAYENWINSIIDESRNLTPAYAKASEEVVKKCLSCLKRIKEGFEIISSNDEKYQKAILAFKLANHAMFYSQVLSEKNKERSPIFDARRKFTRNWDIPYESIEEKLKTTKRGNWRPFQIAFILMTIPSIIDPKSSDRNTVDLIWFPTGGGKTEAYLGLTAFTIFFKTLLGQVSDCSTVLMRYTLRLLTAQQFERASILICAMEYLRVKQYPELLGNKSFKIGLWVGSESTPNLRASAIKSLNDLRTDAYAENQFVILKCPWCGSKFGKVFQGVVHGYVQSDSGKNKTVIYRCEDEKCFYGGDAAINPNVRALPVVVIDEDLFASPPDLLIGTVDKFALLAWNPNARSFFGIKKNGERSLCPPSLIIQDELHLISGPLGSMVGAYETIIDELCTSSERVAPKIIASTATISRANEQIKNLYARDNASLFPPSGINSYDSFFSKEIDRPGRLYVGVLPNGYGSLQTSMVRSFSILLQNAAGLSLNPEDLDPWWTLLVFFNSIRELGGASTLFVSDIRERLRGVLQRRGIPYSQIRKYPVPDELTSRVRSDEVPKILSNLLKKMESIDEKTKKTLPADLINICLASNIIEVGVDVSRLSLMAIVGQPKTTSQYIQVSSRVGRDENKPGLVVMLYGQSKPRDKSHYEKFRSYHQKFYAQVEPTSVTPFSAPAVERALHGVMVALVRQLGRYDYEGSDPETLFSEDNMLVEEVKNIIRKRVDFIAPEELTMVINKLNDRFNQWKAWGNTSYGTLGGYEQSEDPDLMYLAGSEIPASWNNKSWPTLSSLRNVDASCEADVTQYYFDNDIKNINEETSS